MVELPKNNKTTNQAATGFKAWVNRHPVWTIILTIIAFAFIVSLFSGSGSNVSTTTPSQSTQIKQPVLELESIKFYRSGNYVYTEGEIKNIGNQQIRYVQATIEFRDTNGQLVTSDYSYLQLDKLNPSQTSTFSIMTADNSSIVFKKSTIKFIGRIGDSNSDEEIPYKSNATPVYQTTSKPKTTSSAPAPAPAPASTPAPTPLPAPAPAPTPVPVTPKSWHTVATFSGSAGYKNTDTFTTQGAQWRINWTAVATDNYCLANGCPFSFYVNKPGQSYAEEIISSNVSSTKSDVSNIYKSGTFYLETHATYINSWSITVEDYY